MSATVVSRAQQQSQAEWSFRQQAHQQGVCSATRPTADQLMPDTKTCCVRYRYGLS